ncbi:unnamed protein product [Clavelina lepadiformis]|uniref:Uncharacterized protein n=1 Tax=Clavelina lepadiformis TaxID=159417 RepID=A0ABP0F976_CLALP
MTLGGSKSRNKVSVGEPAEGSLSKRTEAPARAAAASLGNRPPLAFVEVKKRPLRRSTRHKSFTGGHIEHRRSERELRLRVNPGTTPASGSSEKQSRRTRRPGECVVGRRPVSPPSRRRQQGFGTRSESAAAADRPRRGVLVSPSRRDRSRTSSILGTCDVPYISA